MTAVEVIDESSKKRSEPEETADGKDESPDKKVKNDTTNGTTTTTDTSVESKSFADLVDHDVSGKEVNVRIGYGRMR
jgi:hypothetical protein